jgi:ribonucleoside-diphosphate reductase alpha chain
MSENKTYSETYISHLNNLINNHFNHLSPVQKDFHLTLSGISRLVMLDRYSQKDKERKTLQVGDVVLTVIKPDPKFPSRGIGKIITKINEKNVVYWVLEIEEEFTANIDPDLMYQGHPHQIIKPDFEIEKPLELYYEQIA